MNSDQIDRIGLNRPHVSSFKRLGTMAVALVGQFLIAVASATADVPCTPEWSALGDGVRGRGAVASLAVFDDGTGPALYAGGGFDMAGGQPATNIAKWDGESWSPLGDGTLGGVLALVVFDDGTGPALYAGGNFIMAGGQVVRNIARWDGESWSSLGTGSQVGTNSQVSALAVFDDGTGPALYAGGFFTTAGGQPADRVARWDGSLWSPVGTGVGDSVRSLVVFDDGSGPALYAGGHVSPASGQTDGMVAKWDGVSWSPIGQGMNNTVQALTVFDDGAGPALYAGGFFTSADGLSANRIARWDGQSWSPLGTGLNGTVRDLSVFDDGSDTALYAGGQFTTAGGQMANGIAMWDGTSWSALGAGTGDNVNVGALAVFDTGSGHALFAGGAFRFAGGSPANGVATWNGESWASVGDGVRGTSEADVRALREFDNGSGPALYVGGGFTGAGGLNAHRIASWDGQSWSPIGLGVNSTVQALTVFDDGSSEALYAGGFFTSAGGLAANRVARWDGESWSPLGAGVNGQVRDFASFDDGSGSALYVAGGFTVAGGQPASRIAKWDGTDWSSVGGGMDGNVVSALAVFDDGSGSALYAGGFFGMAGGVVASNIAKWDGLSWSPLGTGVNGGIAALAVFDDGTGPALYVGGAFDMAGEGPANRIAKWNGQSWSPLGIGTNGGVTALTAFDDGNGLALYAGGNFNSAGGQVIRGVARWDGQSWSSLGSGSQAGTNSPVAALAVFDDGTGPALYAGGSFTTAGGQPANRIARWGGCTAISEPIAVCNAYPTDGEPISGSDITLECESFAGRMVTLDGSGSFHPENHALEFLWEVSESDVVLDDPESAVTSGMFPIGVTMATLTVTDPSGAYSTCDVIIRVEDTMPPQVMVTTDIAALWPPNHTLRPVHVIVMATDECFEPDFVFPVAVTLRSSEPDNAAGNGDGNTTGDCHGEDGYVAPVDITSAFSWDEDLYAWVATIYLRAERAGAGKGRAYTIDATAFDGSGNFGMSSCVIVVPKGMGGGGN